MPTAQMRLRIQRTRSSSRGLKGKLFGGSKVKRARSFSGREKQKWTPAKDAKEDTATTVSDSEAKTHARRPRRRTTGGSETGQEIEKAKRLHAQGNGNSSEPDNQAAQTLSRQQIIAMVKKRFGLKPGEQNGNKPNGIQDVPPAIPPLPTSSPKQKRYELLLDKPGSYPTMPRREENHVPHTNSTPGVVYLQYGDEIKRAMLPAGLDDLQQVQSMFNQTFPDKIKNNADNRKTIYIKDNSCGVFYELDNVGDLSNKSHLKVLESRPFQNGPVSHPVSSSTAVHTGAQVTSTPLPNHSHVAPADAIHSGQGVKYTKTTTVTRQASGGPSVTTVTRVVGSTNEKEESTVSHSVTSGTLMEQKKVPLPGLGASHNLKPRRPSRDPVEDQIDHLTNMLQDALKTGSHDSLPTKNSEGSASSSQSSFIDHGSLEGNEPRHLQPFRSRVRSDSGNESLLSDVSPSTPVEGKPKQVPAPPPRASSSRESSLKYSQTLQRDFTPRGTKRDISVQYQTQTLPLPSTKPKQRLLDSPTPLSSSSSTSSGSHASVKYEGRVKDHKALEVRASTLRGDLRMLRAELTQLKQFQTFQAQQFDEMIQRAKEQIVQRVAQTNSGDDGGLKSRRQKVHVEEMTYIRGKNDINRHISELESEVEMLRLDVVQKRCIANPSEVDSLNSQLGIISRQVSDLKSQFAELHDNMKSVMASELEVIVQGDKFLKEEPSKLENLVSRCKHITGTLFTLQKLVTAQQQIKSESEASFSSLEEVDREVIDSIRSVQREYIDKRGVEHNFTEGPKSPARARQRVRFYDEVTQLP